LHWPTLFPLCKVIVLTTSAGPSARGVSALRCVQRWTEPTARGPPSKAGRSAGQAPSALATVRRKAARSRWPSVQLGYAAIVLPRQAGLSKLPAAPWAAPIHQGRGSLLLSGQVGCCCDHKVAWVECAPRYSLWAAVPQVGRVLGQHPQQGKQCTSLGTRWRRLLLSEFCCRVVAGLHLRYCLLRVFKQWLFVPCTFLLKEKFKKTNRSGTRTREPRLLCFVGSQRSGSSIALKPGSVVLFDCASLASKAWSYCVRICIQQLLIVPVLFQVQPCSLG
jgi:hypothetical protein